MSQQALPDSHSPLLSLPTSELLSAFGAGNPTPGSGSAAALMGLLSAELILTVCSISRDKKSSQTARPFFDKITEDIRCDIKPSLSRLFEEDAELFKQVIAFKRLRDESKIDKEKFEYGRKANEFLARANNCVFSITELCLRLIEHGRFIFEKGWGFVRGDSGAAISASISGVTSGMCILSLNLKILLNSECPGDREYSQTNMEKFNHLFESLKEQQSAALKAATSIHVEAMEALRRPRT